MTTDPQHVTNLRYAKNCTRTVAILLLAIVIIMVVRGRVEFVVVSFAAVLVGVWMILFAFYIDVAIRWQFVRWIPLKEFGEAIAISAFLALSLDYYLRSRTIQAVVDSAAAQYMVYSLPHEVADEVDYVRQIEMLRKNYRVTYTFQPIPGDSLHIRVEKAWSFSIVNYSRKPSPYTHKVVLDESDSSRIQHVAATGDDIDEPYDLDNPGPSFKRQINIRPNSANPANTFEVATVRILRLKDRITDFLVDVPTLSAVVEVEKPPTLDVSVQFGDHKGGACNPISAQRQTWTLKGASLPGLAIEVQWSPTKAPGNSASRAKGAPQIGPQ